MSVFKLDRDAFDRQLAAMEATGQAFEKAQSAFAVAAHSAAAELAKSGSSGASGASFGLSGSSGGAVVGRRGAGSVRLAPAGHSGHGR